MKLTKIKQYNFILSVEIHAFSLTLVIFCAMICYAYIVFITGWWTQDTNRGSILVHIHFFVLHK